MLAGEIRSGDRVLLEGELGAGKTTFARTLLLGLGVLQPPEGSPTFAIAHEYESKSARIIHVDLYRLKNAQEIEDAGIFSYFWDPDSVVICEWLSMWAAFQADVLKGGRNWRVRLDFSATSDRRNFSLTQPRS
jgi:tRNA threonylcarbamoyladenosine biosynthesis protein TsaE